MTNRMLNVYLCLEFLSITKELIIPKKGLYFFIIVNPIPGKIVKNIAKVFSTLQLMRKQLVYNFKVHFTFLNIVYLWRISRYNDMWIKCLLYLRYWLHHATCLIIVRSTQYNNEYLLLAKLISYHVNEGWNPVVKRNFC